MWKIPGAVLLVILFLLISFANKNPGTSGFSRDIIWGGSLIFPGKTQQPEFYKLSGTNSQLSVLKSAPINPDEVVAWAEKQLPGRTRLYLSLYDFETGESFDKNGNISVIPASLIKTLYMVVFLEEVKHGRQSLEAVYILKNEDRFVNRIPVAGMGYLQSQPAGPEYSYEELLALMISRSDNVAANIIINALGLELINQRILSYGLHHTAVNRLMFEATPLNNVTTMNDMVALLCLLESRKIIDGELYNQAVTFMRNSDKPRIGKYSPETVANKIGNISTLVADMAIIYFPQRKPMVLSIMIESTDGKPLNTQEAEEIMARLSEYIIYYYNNTPATGL